MNKNILYYYEQATKQETIDGLQWYARARHEACKMVKNTDIPVICAAGVISVLSPFNPWERNLVDARNVIDAYLNGENPDSVTVSTFKKNKEKAFQILQNNSADIITKKSRKTFSFVHNIAYEDSPYVTIDRHALKVYRRKKAVEAKMWALSFITRLKTHIWKPQGQSALRGTNCKLFAGLYIKEW